MASLLWPNKVELNVLSCNSVEDVQTEEDKYDGEGF